MQGTVDGFGYGLVTPVVAYLMACLGAALGLRCTTRAVRRGGRQRPLWLALGSAAIGSGIWTMHFVAMMGFSVAEAPIGYDRATTFASLAVAVVMVGVGIFVVGRRRVTVMALVTGGMLTGLGIASMHYLGMAGMRLRGTLEYNTFLVALSVLIAVVAAIAALWAAVSLHGLRTTLAASLVMGVAVSGMHYAGMAAVSVHLHPATGPADAGEPATTLLAPVLVGPVLFLLLAAAVVLWDPLLVTGGADARGDEAEESRRPGIPAQRTAAPPPGRAAWAADAARRHGYGGPPDHPGHDG
ncbi:MHYT domain-containing protein [Streptomyces sp. NPDC005805]|uniref:MHYT domain-containing protein n=1 Tax=Streptomyces sp. NPDC005805 TaxID=3157068 RepID=UPI0033DDFACD